MQENGTKPVQTKFNSALPLILSLRDITFGKVKPDFYTRIATYINLYVWITFLSWHIISFSAISLRAIIYTEKKIDVEALIFRRGAELGFRPYEFLNHLLQYHLISIICWGTLFLGIIFMWRKKKIFALFIFGSLAVYLVILLSNMGINYFIEDTTLFDKILLAVITVNSLLYFIFMPRLLTSKAIEGEFQED